MVHSHYAAWVNRHEIVLLATTIRVFACDDHPIVCQGIKQTLADAPDIAAAAEAGNGAEVLLACAREA